MTGRAGRALDNPALLENGSEEDLLRLRASALLAEPLARFEPIFGCDDWMVHAHSSGFDLTDRRRPLGEPAFGPRLRAALGAATDFSRSISCSVAASRSN